MDRIRRHQIGIELFLAQISPYTAPVNDQSPEDTVDIISGQSRSAQNELCRKIQSGIRALLSNRYQVASLLPARVRTFAESQFTPSSDRLLPVFQWIAELHRSNHQARVNWLYELQGAASQIGSGAVDFLQSFSMLSSQRVTLLQGEDNITLSLPDRLWGQAKMVFQQPVFDQPDYLPMFGYIFWADAVAAEEGLRFELTIDTEFSETVYIERLLQDKNWVELSILCPAAKLQVDLCDYAARVFESGIGSYDLVQTCCRELLHKSSILGVASLNQGERALLGVAQLLYVTGMLQAANHPAGSLEQLTELMDNRYAFQRNAAYFEQRCGELGRKLTALLNSALEEYENGLTEKAGARVSEFCGVFQQMVKSGSIRYVSRPLMADFIKACGAFTDPYVFLPYLARARETMVRLLEPALTAYGFTGQFPHYRRIRRRKADLISFVLSDSPCSKADGRIYFSYSISVARCSVLDTPDGPAVFRLPLRDATASECRTDRSSLSSFAELATAEDMGQCVFSYPYDLSQDDGEGERAAKRLLPYLKIADDGLRNKPLPKNYREARKKNLKAKHIFSRLLAELSAVGVFVAIIILLATKSGAVNETLAVLISVGSIIGGVIAVFLMGILSYWRMKTSIWKKE